MRTMKKKRKRSSLAGDTLAFTIQSHKKSSGGEAPGWFDREDKRGHAIDIELAVELDLLQFALIQSPCGAIQQWDIHALSHGCKGMGTGCGREQKRKTGFV